jgi:hypothetical protein
LLRKPLKELNVLKIPKGWARHEVIIAAGVLFYVAFDTIRMTNMPLPSGGVFCYNDLITPQ